MKKIIGLLAVGIGALVLLAVLFIRIFQPESSVNPVEDKKESDAIESIDFCLESIPKNQTVIGCNYRLETLSPLAGMKSLEELDLSGPNVFTKLDPLKDLLRLKKLSIASSKITDISPLKNLAHLEKINLPGSELSDLSPLSNLTNLEELVVGGVNVASLDPLQKLARLRMLSIAPSKISDISVLTNLTHLEEINLFASKVKDIASICNLTKLRVLDLSGTELSDLSPIKCLSNLEELDIGSTPVQDLSPLKKSFSLKKLDIRYTGISELSPLSELTNLEELRMDNAKVSSLKPLKNLKHLKSLIIDGTRVTDISPLKDLLALEHLSLPDGVKNLGPISKLQNLKWLYVGEKVTEVISLSRNKNLKYLYVDCTKIPERQMIQLTQEIPGLKFPNSMCERYNRDLHLFPSDTQPEQPKSVQAKPHASLPEAILNLASLLAKEPLTVDEVVRSLGKVKIDYGSNVVFTPFDPLFLEANLVREYNQQNVPALLILKLARQPAIQTLEKAFGTYKNIKNKRGLPPRVIWYLDMKGFPYTIALIASVSSDKVFEITLRRDKRL